MKIAKMLVLPLMLVGLLSLLIGCKETNVLFFFPKCGGGKLEMTRINTAYQSSVEDLIEENRDKKPFRNIRLQFDNLSDTLYDKIKKEGIKALVESLNKDIEIAIYPEIIQPYVDHPFGDCKIYICYIKKDRVFIEDQSEEKLLSNNTFYAPEFWKSEFKEIFKQLVD